MDNEEERPQERGRALVGAFNAFLIVVAFLFGFMSGVISDGTVEVLNDFRRNEPTRAVAASSPTTAATSSPAASEAATGDADDKRSTPSTVSAKASGTIEWSITVPPGTALTDVLVTSRQKSDPIRLRLASLERGKPASTAATMWLDPGASATISLPSGWYRVGGTRLKPGLVWDERAGDETYLDRALRVDPVDPSARTPSISMGEDGTLTSRDARTSGRAERPKQKRRREVRDEDYFGLGRGDGKGGNPTYG